MLNPTRLSPKGDADPQPSARLSSPDGQLFALASGSAVLYTWLALRYPLLPGLAIGRASWATLGERSLGAGLVHAAIYGLLLLLYALAIRRLSQADRAASRGSTLAIIWVCWLLASLVLLGTYPGESLDIFDYLFRGRMLIEEGASPLAQSPTPYSDRPFYDLITWRGQVDTYGPLWEYASGGVAWAVGRLISRPFVATTATLAAYITGYRLLAIVVSGLCGALVYQIVRRRAAPLAPAALLAWLWNPLLLIASAVGAHNDLLLVLWLLLALWLLQRQRWALGLLAMLLAAHVKLTALLLAPVVALWLVRRIGWRPAVTRSLLALSCALPLSWLLYAPLGGWATLPRMLRERTRFLANAPADLLYRWLQERAGWDELAARQLATGGATILFCLVATLVIAVMLDLHATLPRATGGAAPVDDTALWRCGLAVTTVYLMVGSFWFMPWYVLWALPLAALLPATDATRLWLPALTLGALWSGLAADLLTFADPPGLSPTLVSWVSVSLMLAPLAGAALSLGWTKARLAPRTSAPAARLHEQ